MVPEPRRAIIVDWETWTPRSSIVSEPTMMHMATQSEDVKPVELNLKAQTIQESPRENPPQNPSLWAELKLRALNLPGSPKTVKAKDLVTLARN